MNPAMSPQDIEQLAQRRAKRKMGWYTHAFVYVVVNLGLALKSAFTGHNWAIYPLLGWGLGLMIHGIVVFVVRRPTACVSTWCKRSGNVCNSRTGDESHRAANTVPLVGLDTGPAQSARTERQHRHCPAADRFWRGRFWR